MPNGAVLRSLPETGKKYCDMTLKIRIVGKLIRMAEGFVIHRRIKFCVMSKITVRIFGGVLCPSVVFADNKSITTTSIFVIAATVLYVRIVTRLTAESANAAEGCITFVDAVKQKP